MRHLLPSWTLLWCSFSICSGGVIEDYPDKVTVCHDLHCLNSVAQRFEPSGELIVLTITYSVDYDGYLPLYCGWIFEMLEKIPFHLVYFDLSHMILGPEQAGVEDSQYILKATSDFVALCATCDANGNTCSICSEKNYSALKAAAFQYNPKRLAVVIIKDAEFRIDLCNYKLLREMNGLPVPVLFHLNDEMPWESKQMCNNSVIHDTYGVAPVTLRNYYFDETNSRALFYPLGAGRLSYLKILKSNAFLAELPPVPSSQRNFICSFAGRKQYKDSSSDGAIERAELMAIIAAMQESGGPSCYSLFSDMDENNVAKHGLDFNTYFNVMRNSIFAPCPGGNNPETFRHYEALEVGAIPLMIRIKRPERNFFLSWVGYPGPVFESWADLAPFLRSINGSYVDDLQKKVSSWYMAFKLHQQEHIAEMLEQAFEPVSSASSGLNESPAELFVEESCCTERQEMQDQIEYLQNNIADLVRRVQVLEEQYQAKPIP